MPEQSIASQFHDIAHKLEKEGKPPVRVIFSHKGYYKALAERGGGHDNLMPDTYMGLPYTVRSDMAGDIGLDYKFETRKDAVTIQLGYQAHTGHITVDGEPFGEPIQVMQVVGRSLNAPQLCDIIAGWLETNGSKEELGLRNALDIAVRRHGRFE